jgi:hypothetical protein
MKTLAGEAAKLLVSFSTESANRRHSTITSTEVILKGNSE